MFWICSEVLIRFFIVFTTKNKGTLLKAMLLSPKKKRIEQRSGSSSVFLKEKNQIVFRDLSTEEDYLFPVDQNPPAPLTEG